MGTFYLPKLEHYKEGDGGNEVSIFQNYLGINQGTRLKQRSS